MAQMTSASSTAAWLPARTILAIERIDAPDLEARAAGAGIRAYAENLVPKRRLEYLAGRLAARAALQSVGADEPAVGSDDGKPVWPQGYCGSISHSVGLAVALAASCRDWRALGIDIEARFPAHRARILQKVMGADEFEDAQASADPWVWTRAWAAKEAAYKCLSALGVEIAFEALVPRWTSTGRGELRAWVGGAFVQIDLECRMEDEVIWMVASAAAESGEADGIGCRPLHHR